MSGVGPMMAAITVAVRGGLSGHGVYPSVKTMMRSGRGLSPIAASNADSHICTSPAICQTIGDPIDPLADSDLGINRQQCDRVIGHATRAQNALSFAENLIDVLLTHGA
jgi:hypothetical protein